MIHVQHNTSILTIIYKNQETRFFTAKLRFEN